MPKLAEMVVQRYDHWFEDWLNTWQSEETFQEKAEDRKKALIARAWSKHEHIHNVLELATNMALIDHMSEEDQLLAQVIAILHDCGRFPQLALYGNFLDHDEFNHSIKGADMLQDGLLHQLFPEVQKEEETIIVTAVRCHGLLSLPPDLDARTLRHCKLIRDADRTDLFERSCNRFEELFSAYEYGKPKITPEVLQHFLNKEKIHVSKCQSKFDTLVLRLGLICQYEFTSALVVIEQKHYIQRLCEKFRNLSWDVNGQTMCYDPIQLERLQTEAEKQLSERKTWLTTKK